VKRDAPEPIVLVDALNVMRSRWPNMRADRFVGLARLWAAREGVGLIVVFDGPAPGGLVGQAELDGRTTLVGTGRESADDWIAREAQGLSAAGRRLWLVSSDRGLRERVAPHVDRTVGGGSFATRLETLERERGAMS
jgi:hypothetical protein